MGTWDTPTNANWGLVDNIVGGISSISVTSGQTVLNAAQASCGLISVSGTISGSASIAFPAVSGWWSINNATTGGLLLAQAVGGSIVIGIPPGEITDIQMAGTSIFFRNLGRIGSYLDLAVSSVPSWITSCTVPPYLNCDGSPFSGGTYPYLAGLIGTTLPDLRGRSRFYLNQATGRITAGVSGINGDAIFSGGGDQNLFAHSHSVSGVTGSENQNHQHTLGPAPFTVGTSSVGNGNASPGAAGPAESINNTTSIENAVHNHNFSGTTSTSGAGNSQNMPPALISGITLIRAG